MGIITQQPNGLYARISTVVDAPTHENMTKDDLEKYLEESDQLDFLTPDVDSFLKKYARPFDVACYAITDLNITKDEKEEWIRKVSEKEE